MNSPDAELVRRAARGEEHAVAALLAWARPMVLRYCLARLGLAGSGYATAEDVAQDVCLTVLRVLPRFQDQGRPFAAFAYGIAARKVSESGRAARRRPAQTSLDALADRPDPAAGPEPLAIAADLSARLHRMLSRLSPVQREVIILRVAVGLPTDEVAAALAITPTRVRVTQHRALKRLRALADEILDEVTPR
ncbi:MAG TPA: sigma-70 family RNA polymerase sigma factor [Micromonosporaceae bacterium]|nr:sigma-70 family RNA polymerase sigma factor [Micromonosporaceae bacterium]